mmetsp:Transcript_29094/g.74858  ORF Transcript_29094/g.74858 Transcript_29094/m.74858 type:complete len:279 (-) Transcript_29094:349-1185(-)
MHVLIRKRAHRLRRAAHLVGDSDRAQHRLDRGRIDAPPFHRVLDRACDGLVVELVLAARQRRVAAEEHDEHREEHRRAAHLGKRAHRLLEHRVELALVRVAQLGAEEVVVVVAVQLIVQPQDGLVVDLQLDKGAHVAHDELDVRQQVAKVCRIERAKLVLQAQQPQGGAAVRKAVEPRGHPGEQRALRVGHDEARAQHVDHARLGRAAVGDVVDVVVPRLFVHADRVLERAEGVRHARMACHQRVHGRLKGRLRRLRRHRCLILFCDRSDQCEAHPAG